MSWRSAFSVSGNGKSRTWRRFSSVNEVPVLDIKCPTYSTSLRPSLVFSGLAVTFFSRSLPSTLRVLSRYSLSVVPKSSTSSIYISHIRVTYPANTVLAILHWKKGPEPLSPMAALFHSYSPYCVMKAVYSWESGCKGVWWFDCVWILMCFWFGLK